MYLQGGNVKQRPATGQSIIGIIACEEMHYSGITLYTDVPCNVYIATPNVLCMQYNHTHHAHPHTLCGAWEAVRDF